MDKFNAPLEKECHCGKIADKYRQRMYINQMGFKVFRVFYRCRNCWSRINEDFIPELKDLNRINLFDLKDNDFIFSTPDKQQ